MFELDSLATPPSCTLSVVMPVLNGMPYLDDAITSILSQTLSDFEFVILDDGSTDGSQKRLEFWAEKDDRIRIVRSDGASGPVTSSNAVAAEARGELIARMDADDVSAPSRLETQVSVLMANPDAVAVGSLSRTIDAKGVVVRPADYFSMLRRSRTPPFGHSTLMVRRDAFHRAGGYRPGSEKWEDLDLYDRLSSIGQILVIPKVLGCTRISPVSSRMRADRETIERSMNQMLCAIEKRRPPTSSERISPKAFVLTGSLDIWQGRRPQVLSRLFRSGALGVNLETILVLAWVVLAELSPRVLRGILVTSLIARNWVATIFLNRRDAIIWKRDVR